MNPAHWFSHMLATDWLQIVFFTALFIVAVYKYYKSQSAFIQQKPNKHDAKTKKKKQELPPNKVTAFIIKYEWFLFISIFLFAFVIRAWKFGEIPAGLNQDGAMAAVDANAILHHGTDRYGMRFPVHFTAWSNAQMSVLLSYLMIPFIKIFGLTVFAIRLPILIVSMTGLFVLYKFTKKITSIPAALIILTFASINPWHFMQSRWALDCNIFPHFFLFGLYFLYLGIEKNKYMYISMIFFGLSMYAYGIAFYAVPLFLAATAVYLLITKNVNIKSVLCSVLCFLLTAWPIMTVIFLNFFRLPTIETPFFTMPFFSETTRQSDLIFFSDSFGKDFLRNLNTFINLIVFQYPDHPWNNVAGFGNMFIFTSPFFIGGLCGIIYKMRTNIHKQKEKISTRNNIGYIFILMFLALGVFVGLVTETNVNRVNIIFYPIIIITGYGIYILIKQIKLSSVAIGLVFSLLFCAFSNVYFGENNQKLSKGFLADYGQSLEYVEDIDFEQIYITGRPAGYYNNLMAEILVMFYHNIDAEYFQGKSTKSNNKENLLPYKEKYIYVNYERSPNLQIKGTTVFIARHDELDYFSDFPYRITEVKTFGDFDVIIAENHIEPSLAIYE